ncbi:hypothetical protein [Paenibacillus pini]|uniref:Uncharacterized protein n=1 Tax=Paenibacillus pini JCM 16418 TaxID=1236976 RepID=W7YVW2_9BACL|nr:hypothetical protein [Paenibacillus pini]GAF06519.1 hypothetical protein JCM16418_478 [Paenibacillus pini JCM 16418]
MISDEELNAFRVSGEQVRVVRDGIDTNDVIGIVVAWDGEQVLIRRKNRKVVKLGRQYSYQSAEQPRISPLELQ